MTRAADPRVPGFLGRVVDANGTPVGTCFQVAPGVLVTAGHVVDQAGAGLRVGQLDGDATWEAAAVPPDRDHDLAVLRTDQPLKDSCDRLRASDYVAIDTRVVIAGYAEVDDQSHRYDYLQTSGVWQGFVRRDDLPWCRVTADSVMPGMSGAPVIGRDDGVIVGVVSGRYNSIDGWLARSVWVARCEDLGPLLEDISSVRVRRPALRQAVDATPTLTETEVRLTGPGIDAGESRSTKKSRYNLRKKRPRWLTAAIGAALIAGALLLTPSAYRLAGPARPSTPPTATPSFSAPPDTAPSASISPALEAPSSSVRPVPGNPIRYPEGTRFSSEMGDPLWMSYTSGGIYLHRTGYMIWAHMGVPAGEGDRELWLERSFDGGLTFESQRWGVTLVKSGEEQATPMYTFRHPDKGYGQLRACQKRVSQQTVFPCTNLLPSCNDDNCDGLPNREASKSQEVDRLTRGASTSILHHSPAGDSMWFTLFNSTPEVESERAYLERIFDDGTSQKWLAFRWVPRGSTSFYNTAIFGFTDKFRGRSKLRMCLGATGDLCTQWYA